MSVLTPKRARVAALHRHRSPDDPELIEARVQLAAARAEQRIRELLDFAPPLSDETRSRLADLLRPNGDEASDG